jgi:hypothetical protein
MKSRIQVKEKGAILLVAKDLGGLVCNVMGYAGAR